MMVNSPRARWILLGGAAYLLFMLALLPAGLLSSTLVKHGIATGALSGSIWNGEAQQLQAGVLNLGRTSWRWRPLALFTGKLAVDVRIQQVNGRAAARFAWSLGGKLVVSQLDASMPLQSLVGNTGLPGGWIGTAQARFDEVVLEDNWPVAAHGQLDVLDLTGPSRAPSNLGSYHLVFPAEGTRTQALVGQLSDRPDAALAVSGTLTLNPDRSYALDTLVLARANAPADVVKGMQFLGPPDAQGRRPFSVSGTF